MTNVTIFTGRNANNIKVTYVALGTKKRFENPAKYPGTTNVIKLSSINNYLPGIDVADLTKDAQQVAKNEKGFYVC